MKFNELSRKTVFKEVADKAEREINAVNEWQDKLKGVSIGIEMIQQGQTGSYQDHVYSARIFCYQPNSWTTNAPMLRTINLDQAKEVARIFVHHFDDEPKDWASARLVACRPEPNPCGLDEPKLEKYNGKIVSSCWYVQINLAYTG